MKNLNELTAEQEAMIILHREMWINKFYQNKGIDKERAIEQIKWMYKFCGYKEPVIVFMDSPLGSQILVSLANMKELNNISANIGDNIWDNIWDNIGDNIWNNISANIGDNIWNNISANIGDNIRDNIWNNISANIRDNISANIGANISANIGANIGDNIWANIRANIGDNIRDNISDNIRANIGDNIWDNIWNNIGANIWDNISANIGDNIWDNIWDNIGDNIRANIRDNIWANIGANIGEYTSASYYGNISDYGWVAFWDYFQSLNVFLDFDWSKFDNFKTLLNSGIYEMITLDGLCVVCSMPKVTQDANNRLHNIDKAAVIFNDGFSMNYIHGVYLSDEIFNKLQLKEYTFEDWVKEPNEEIKAACLSFMEEKFGGEYLFRFLSEYIKEVDTFVNKKDEKFLVGTTGGMNIGVYTLFKGGINEIELAFVRCYCPSTDRMFFLSVDPVNSNAKDAIASLYRVPSKLKNEIKYIQRQGERFSTVFTEQGMKELDAMSEVEISDLVSISGEEYFNKMQYEF